MRKQLLHLSFIVLALVFISGCGKDNDPAPAQKTKTELITQSPWKFQSASSSLLGDISTYPQLACYVDNVMTLSANLSGTIAEGTVVCTSPAPTPFTWGFLNNETTLHLSFTLFAGGSPDFTIGSLTETNLVLSQSVTFSGVPQTITVTFKH
jgi:hypothetical protein